MGASRFLVNEPSVISESIDGETIVLNFDNGHYYSLNAVGSVIWGHLARGAALDDVAGALAARYALAGPSMLADVTAFAARLEQEHLIRPALNGETAASGPEAGDALPADFAPPDFEKFTDMEKLLLLDPIHEVGDGGWPHGRPR